MNVGQRALQTTLVTPGHESNRRTPPRTLALQRPRPAYALHLFRAVVPAWGSTVTRPRLVLLWYVPPTHPYWVISRMAPRQGRRTVQWRAEGMCNEQPALLIEVLCHKRRSNRPGRSMDPWEINPTLPARPGYLGIQCFGATFLPLWGVAGGDRVFRGGHDARI